MARFRETEALVALRSFAGAKSVVVYRDTFGRTGVVDEAKRLLAWQDNKGNICIIQDTPELHDLEAPDKFT